MTHLGDVITTTTTTAVAVVVRLPRPVTPLDALGLALGITAHAKWAHKKDKEIIFTLNTRASAIEGGERAEPGRTPSRTKSIDVIFTMLRLELCSVSLSLSLSVAPQPKTSAQGVVVLLSLLLLLLLCVLLLLLLLP